MKHTYDICPDDDVMSIKDFRKAVECNDFTDDDDGFGYAVVNGMVPDTSFRMLPSQAHLIPDYADSVVWFNR